MTSFHLQSTYVKWQTSKLDLIRSAIILPIHCWWLLFFLFIYASLLGIQRCKSHIHTWKHEHCLYLTAFMSYLGERICYSHQHIHIDFEPNTIETVSNILSFYAREKQPTLWNVSNRCICWVWMILLIPRIVLKVIGSHDKKKRHIFFIRKTFLFLSEMKVQLFVCLSLAMFVLVSPTGKIFKCPDRGD